MFYFSLTRLIVGFYFEYCTIFCTAVFLVVLNIINIGSIFDITSSLWLVWMEMVFRWNTNYTKCIFQVSDFTPSGLLTLCVFRWFSGDVCGFHCRESLKVDWSAQRPRVNKQDEVALDHPRHPTGLICVMVMFANGRLFIFPFVLCMLYDHSFIYISYCINDSI